MNIIIEGPKGTGKSTICKKIEKECKFRYYHSTQNTLNTFSYHLNLLDSEYDCIFDRFHLGELVYPIVYHRKGKLSVKNIIALSRQLNTLQIVLYSSDTNIIIQRICERDNRNDLTSTEKSEIFESNKLFKVFGEFLEAMGCNIKLIDIANDNSWKKELINAISKREIDAKTIFKSM